MSDRPQHPEADRRLRPRADADAGAIRRKWFVLLSVGVGTYMSGLDGSVVNALLPVIRRALGTSVAGIEWVVTVYLLVVSGVLLGFGRLGDLRGHRRVYLIGLAGFTVSSALCGLSPSAGWLIGFRALQALAAAMIFSNAPAILTRSFPPEERGRALGLQALMTYLGLSTGPLLGGLLSRHYGWGSIFFINVPVGLLAVTLAHRFVARDEPARAGVPFDLLGATLFFVGLFLLLLGLNQGHAWGWGALATVAVLGAGAAVLAAFVAVESRRVHPVLDLTLFQSVAFSSSVLAATVNYVGNFTVVFLLPFFLIQGRGLSPTQAGLVLTAQPVVMMVSSPLAGALSDRIGSRAPATFGMAVLSAGLWLLSRAGVATPLWHIALTLGFCGLGLGAFTAPNNSRILGSAPRHRQGIASGVLAAARNVGMVLGVGLAGAVYTTVLESHGPDAVPQAVSAGLLAAAALTGLAVFPSAMGGAR